MDKKPNFMQWIKEQIKKASDPELRKKRLKDEIEVAKLKTELEQEKAKFSEQHNKRYSGMNFKLGSEK